MSRIFSVSLVTLMILTSLLGASPQAGFAQSSATSPESATQETSSGDVTDQSEGVEETPTAPVEPEVGESVPEGTGQQPDVIDEPVEDANSPPSEDAPADNVVETPTEVVTEVPVEEAPAEVVTEEPVVETPTEVATEEPVVETPTEVVTEEPVVETPNEVVTEEPVVETPTEVVTEEPEQDEPAKIAPASKSTNPDADGEKDAIEDDTKIVPNAVDPKPGECPIGESCDGGGGGGESSTEIEVAVVVYRWELADGMSIRVPVNGATVQILNSDSSPHSTQLTQNGQIMATLEVGKTYSITVSAVNHVESSYNLLVKEDTGSVEVPLRYVDTFITLTVTDSVTSEPVPGATVHIYSQNGGGWYTTDDNGQIQLNWVSAGVYNVSIEAAGYESMPQVQTEFLVGTVNLQYSLLPLDAPITITSQVVDIDTGLPIEGADITVTRTSDGKEIRSGKTDESGMWAAEAIAPDEYNILVTMDGYLDQGTKNFERKDRTITFKMVKVDQPATIFGYIWDANTYDRIPHATFTVRGEGMDQSITADEYGKVEWLKLKPGEYVFIVEADGYETHQFEKTIEAVYQYHFHIDMVPIAKVDVAITIQAPAPVDTNLMASTTVFTPSFHQVAAGMQPVANASVQLHTIDTNSLVGEGSSNDQGLVLIPGVDEGTYRLTVVVPGYEPHTQEIDLTEGPDHTITLAPTTPDDPETPTNPEPGDGDEPTNPEPGDGTTPVNPEPGDGGTDTPTNPDPVDDGTDTSTNPDPVDDGTDTPTNPDPVDDGTDTPTNPEPVDSGNNTPTNPDEVAGSGATTDPDTGGSESIDGSAEVVETADSAVADEIAQAGTSSTTGSSSDQAESVSRLPATGSGQGQSHVLLSSLLMLAGASLILGTAIRRRVR